MAEKPVPIEGLEELIRSFNRMADPASYVHLDNTVKDVAHRIKRLAKSPGYCPVRSGRLRKSISARKQRVKKSNPIISYNIGPRNVTYNGLVQLGHRKPKSAEKVKPNDFMRRAAEDTREAFIDAAVKTFTEEIDRLGGSK